MHGAARLRRAHTERAGSCLCTAALLGLVLTAGLVGLCLDAALHRCAPFRCEGDAWLRDTVRDIVRHQIKNRGVNPTVGGLGSGARAECQWWLAVGGNGREAFGFVRIQDLDSSNSWCNDVVNCWCKDAAQPADAMLVLTRAVQSCGLG